MYGELIRHLILACLRSIVHRIPLARPVLRIPLVWSIRNWLLDQEVPSRSDRKYLCQTILPRLSEGPYRRVLFVGCRRYTKDYGSYFAGTGIEFWTTDIDPSAKIWAEPERHIQCDIRKIDTMIQSGSFDVVLLNGVFGFGVDDTDSMNQALETIHRILKPSGLLVIGWNVGLIADPLSLENVKRNFAPTALPSLPKRKTFLDTSHVYDFLKAV